MRKVENLLQGLIDESYKQFTEAVAEGRNLPVEEVRKFADGRIFTGTQAKELVLLMKLEMNLLQGNLLQKWLILILKFSP